VVAYACNPSTQETEAERGESEASLRQHNSILSPKTKTRAKQNPYKSCLKEGIKGIQVGKETVKISLYSDHTVLYLKDPKNYSKASRHHQQL
jgi:hypothetical protein